VKKRCEKNSQLKIKKEYEAERPQGHCEGGTKADPLPADGTRSTTVPGPKPGATAAAAHAHATSVSPFAVYRFIGLNDVAVKG